MEVPGPYPAGIFVADETATFTSQGSRDFCEWLMLWKKQACRETCTDVVSFGVSQPFIQSQAIPLPTHSLLVPNEIQLLPQPSASSAVSSPLGN